MTNEKVVSSLYVVLPVFNQGEKVESGTFPVYFKLHYTSAVFRTAKNILRTRGSGTKVVGHRSPLSPTKVSSDFCHRPSTDFERTMCIIF